MDTAPWPQEIGLLNSIEGSSNTCTKPMIERSATTTKEGQQQKPKKNQVLNCPRCNSTNTKFCYYNNYSLTQPRYFCKTCRRYWTEGGTLRNIPVGGASRKNKKFPSSSSSSSSRIATSSSSKQILHLDLMNPPTNPKILEHGQDLNLTFPQDYSIGIASSRGLSSYIPMAGPMPDSNSIYPSPSLGFLMHEFKPNLGFSVEGLKSGGFENFHNQGYERILFPFGGDHDQMREQLSSSNTNHHEVVVDLNKGQGNSNGLFWNNGMLGNGGSW